MGRKPEYPEKTPGDELQKREILVILTVHAKMAWTMG